MAVLSSNILDIIQSDPDEREELIRRIVFETLTPLPAPCLRDDVVATYFVWAHDLTPAEVGREIAYHMTSGVRNPPEGSLLAACTGKVIDSVTFDPGQRCGLVRVAFPLAMLRDEAGTVHSTDLLHVAAGAGVFALRENRDVKLVDLALSEELMRTFPGPAYGPDGLRDTTAFSNRVAFGTILKPCTGIQPQEEAEIVYQAAANPLFLFIKEDENFLPGVPFAPVCERAKACLRAIERAREHRGEAGLIFAVHITSSPHLLRGYVEELIALGVNGLMFSEYYIGGAVRMIRELTRGMDRPPAIYGHNGGIDVMTRAIYREVLDLLARLDGVDIRQTAPLTTGRGLLRPWGQEWRNVERVLTMPLPGITPTMIARAGGLDQGNIIANLRDIEQHGDIGNYLFLAGSAINGIKNSHGEYDPRLGARAMEEALVLYQSGDCLTDDACSVPALTAAAAKLNMHALVTALRQRYPGPCQ